jgi:hypothetical protein
VSGLFDLTVIVPVGVPAPGAVTASVTETATGPLTIDGLGRWLPMVVVVLALFTVRLPFPAGSLLLAANVALPV